MEINLETLRTLFSGLTLVSIIIAYFTFKTNKAKNDEDKKIAKDKEVNLQATQSLEWAYEVLTQGNVNQVPEPDRLNWLTAARHIQRYYKLRGLIKTDTYKLLNAEVEEYWRHTFYRLLDRKEMANINYFTDNANQEWPENIELTSAMIISEFSQWDENIEDPIDIVEREDLINKGAFKGVFGRGLRTYSERLFRK